MKRWANDIGPNLRRVRLRLGLTQEQFAAKLQIAGADMTRQVVANMEARRRRVYEHQIRLVIKVSRCTLNELFFGVPPATNRNPPLHSKPSRR
jgi:transcriptional regulator with XRE-family HTH domain